MRPIRPLIRRPIHPLDRRLASAVALTCAALLAGCGGSGGGAAPGTSPSAGARGYDQVAAEASGLRASLAGQREVDRARLPDSGRASYSGYLTLASAGLPSRVVGDMTLSVDFADNDTSGLAGNFVGADGTAYDGSLHGRGTLSTGGVATATTTLAGTLRSGSRDWDMRVGTQGAFLAPDGALIEGTAVTRGGADGRDVTAAMILALD